MDKNWGQIWGGVSKFWKKHHWWIQFVILAVIILIGVLVRISPIDNSVDPTTGEHISTILDSEFFNRYAGEIAENGALPEIDTMRSAPLGQPTGVYGFYTSYFVAGLWGFMGVFDSDISISYVDIIYPIIAMVILSLFFFLLLRRIFNWKVAVVATLLLNVLPAFLFRSLGGSSDHDVLVMMLFVMALYFLFVAWDSKNLKSCLPLVAVAAFITFLANAAGGGGLFILTLVGVVVIVMVLMNKFTTRESYMYVTWFVVFNVLLGIAGVNPMGFVKSLSTVPAYLAFLVVLIDYIVYKKNLWKMGDKLGERLPKGFISFIIAIVVGVILYGITAGFGLLAAEFGRLYDYVFNAFQYGRVGLTVAENKKSFVIDWFSSFGTFFVLLFTAGAITLFYKIVKPLGKKLKKNLTIAFAIFLILYIFTRYSPDSLFNGKSGFSLFLFFAAVILFVVYLVYIYFNTYYKDRETFNLFSKINKGYLILLFWFLIMVIGATSAIRLLFEFSPTTVIMASFFLVFVFDWFIKHKQLAVNIIGVIVILMVLFSPIPGMQGLFVGYYETSNFQATHTGPGYNSQWQLAGEWVRENTPENSTFVHWWDYGYWVQTGFNRPTVTDGGHAVGWWDYLIARDVLTAPDLETPLKFLKAHEVNYLLIIKDEIGKYPAYSSIGSDATSDRLSYIPTFMVNPQATKENRNSTSLFYQGQFVLDEDFVKGSKVYPKSKSAVVGVIFTMKNIQGGNESVGFDFEQPEVVLADSNSQEVLKLQCVWMNGKEYTYDEYDFPGCFRIMPHYINQQQQAPLGAGFFLSEKTYNSVMVRLYLLEQENPYYKLVYDDSNNQPLAIFGSSFIGPIKIWEVSYPDDLVLTEEELEYNLRTTYADTDLENPL